MIILKVLIPLVQQNLEVLVSLFFLGKQHLDLIMSIMNLKLLTTLEIIELLLRNNWLQIIQILMEGLILLQAFQLNILLTMEIQFLL